MDMWIDKTEIDQRALQVRQECNIQTYGIKDIFSLVSQRGINLIRYPFGKDRILGFSTLFEGQKIIISNSSEILSREIFTIAHELGHIVYDFEDGNGDIKIDIEITDYSEDISEARAYLFANSILMPEEEITKYVKYELKRKHQEINALDIVRLQLEFQVSYAAATKRLCDMKIISPAQKAVLFNDRNATTSSALFEKLDVDKCLLRSTNVIEVPSNYLEYVLSNYENDYIPYSSLEKSFNLIGMDPKVFKKEKQNNEKLDFREIFEEFE